MQMLCCHVIPLQLIVSMSFCNSLHPIEIGFPSTSWEEANLCFRTTKSWLKTGNVKKRSLIISISCYQWRDVTQKTSDSDSVGGRAQTTVCCCCCCCLRWRRMNPSNHHTSSLSILQLNMQRCRTNHHIFFQENTKNWSSFLVVFKPQVWSVGENLHHACVRHKILTVVPLNHLFQNVAKRLEKEINDIIKPGWEKFKITCSFSFSLHWHEFGWEDLVWFFINLKTGKYPAPRSHSCWRNSGSDGADHHHIL